MKTIWIEGSETAGLLNDFANGFRNYGYRVFTFAKPNKFYDYKYDFTKFTFLKDLKNHGLLNWPILSTLGFRIVAKYFNSGLDKYIKRIQMKILLREVDYILPIYDLHYLNHKDFKYLTENSVKIIGVFLGSEVRVYDIFCKHFEVKKSLIDKEYFVESFSEKATLLRYFEKYSHCVFSVPDQMSLSTRPYFHLQLPFNLAKFICKVPLRRKPVIIHCPSNTGIKGTKEIIECIRHLEADGVEFEFRLLQNLKHEDLLKELTDADILIDELILHGPGLLSFEAMLSGCVVLTKHYEISPDSFNPPIISCTINNLKLNLEELIVNLEKRKYFAVMGRKYAEDNNSIEKVILRMKRLIESKLAQDSAYDYVNDFEFVYNSILTDDQKVIIQGIDRDLM